MYMYSHLLNVIIYLTLCTIKDNILTNAWQFWKNNIYINSKLFSSGCVNKEFRCNLKTEILFLMITKLMENLYMYNYKMLRQKVPRH